MENAKLDQLHVLNPRQTCSTSKVPSGFVKHSFPTILPLIFWLLAISIYDICRMTIKVVFFCLFYCYQSQSFHFHIHPRKMWFHFFGKFHQVLIILLNNLQCFFFYFSSWSGKSVLHASITTKQRHMKTLFASLKIIYHGESLTSHLFGQ